MTFAELNQYDLFRFKPHEKQARPEGVWQVLHAVTNGEYSGVAVRVDRFVGGIERYSAMHYYEVELFNGN